MEDKVKEKIGDGLIRIGAMTTEQVKKVLQVQREKYCHDKLFGDIATELQFVDQETIEEYLNS
ncbi:MAG: hypothetical protein GH155_03750 [Spirochaeta sp.]|nr:hypothetical protein [Spirochaeta sp.]